MYATRSAANDENNTADVKGQNIKGAPLDNNGKMAAVQSNNRRALGDIGNLVGSLSARCNVSKDGATENPPIAKQPLQMDRPVTRRFIAALANGQISARPTNAQVPAIGDTARIDIKSEEVTAAWGAKQRRKVITTKAQDACVDCTSNAASKASEVVKEAEQSKNLEAPSETAPKQAIAVHPGHPARLKALMKNGRAPGAKKEKKQTLTSILTARSEAACRGFEVAEAEQSVNIDEADIGNQLAVVDYVEDIYSFYRKIEVQSCVPANYMSKQTDINEKMRAILIDWLIEVHLKFKLMPETLFLTTNLIDRYLSCQIVSRKYLQLVGVTAMLVASKYEEIWAPEVQDFVFISDNAYTRDQVLGMEKKMLNTLRFNLTVPTPYVFIVRFLKAAASDQQMIMVAFFLVELCLTEYTMVKFSPSLLAAAAVYTAQCTLQRTPLWSATLHRHSGYTEEQLKECAGMMVAFHQNAGKGNLTVVHKKYSNAKFEGVAALSPATLPWTAYRRDPDTNTSN
ncbi:hypothetical protein O6H91_02G063700 [Diphasiastrum complanatum]|uniref:Uncharacterized protein n=1 Tax=Diphasiastrum complanatum TaxID=34168 RepID=A0ACC2EGT3_DIPCM|nr:hypothetical protein O6H91_02G063700 [Diphasiastrum complanatum]